MSWWSTQNINHGYMFGWKIDYVDDNDDIDEKQYQDDEKCPTCGDARYKESKTKEKKTT